MLLTGVLRLVLVVLYLTLILNQLTCQSMESSEEDLSLSSFIEPSTTTTTTPNNKTTGHLDLVMKFVPKFSNITLVASVVVREPFVIYNEPVELLDGTNSKQMERSKQAKSVLDNYSGVAVEILKRLRHIFKFKLIVRQPKDNQFGVYSNELNQWTGLMGDLVRGEADIGVTALSITISRARAIDFTRAYYVETAAILMRTPEEVENYFAIFQPFSTATWCLLLGTIIALITLITIMTKLEDAQLGQKLKMKLLKNNLIAQSPTGGQNNNNDDNKPAQHPFGSSWLERFYYAVTCVINILLVRDIKHPPRQTPIRILVCIWWLITIVIVNIYLGILFGQLVVPQRPKSIETLEELVSQKQVAWCVTQGSAIYELFRQSQAASVYGQLGMGMRNVSSADEGVAKVLQKGWAFIREKSILTFKVAKEHNRIKDCKMQLAKEEFYSVGFGLGLRKNSPYLEAFNSALTMMIEDGFVAHWQSMYWPTKNSYTECGLGTTEGNPLSIKHFISIFLVCTIITGLALLVLIYQRLFTFSTNSK